MAPERPIPLIDRPQTLRKAEGAILRVCPVTLRKMQGPHRETQDLHMVSKVFRMERQGQEIQADRLLIMDSQEIALDTHTLAMNRPHTQARQLLLEGDPQTVRLVMLRGILVSPRDTQSPHRVSLDLNIQSQDLQ